MKLKIFSDKQYLARDGAIAPILYPFFGKPTIDNPDQIWLKNVTLPAFEHFIQTADLYFEMVPIEDADLVILPSDLLIFNQEVKHKSLQLIEQARNHQKRVAGFFSGDLSHLRLPLNLDISFRECLYRSSRRENEFLMPSWIDDLTKIHGEGQLPIREKQAKPVIGFCGYAAPTNLKTIAKTVLYKYRNILPKQKGKYEPYYTPPYYTGHVIRSLALSKLENSALVETNFILRRKAGLLGKDSDDVKSYRSIFVENTFNSDYVFCCRGSGNYSNRFYEALCCGRIPIFVDTDCVLPLDFDINWKDYCVYIREDELPQLDRKILEFHENITPSKFVELQHQCRKLWEDKLSPEGFFSQLYRHLQLLEK